MARDVSGRAMYWCSAPHPGAGFSGRRDSKARPLLCASFSDFQRRPDSIWLTLHPFAWHHYRDRVRCFFRLSFQRGRVALMRHPLAVEASLPPQPDPCFHGPEQPSAAHAFDPFERPAAQCSNQDPFLSGRCGITPHSRFRVAQSLAWQSSRRRSQAAALGFSRTSPTTGMRLTRNHCTVMAHRA
jgi:hypothetical protein